MSLSQEDHQQDVEGGQPVKIREYAQQIYREVHVTRSGFMTDDEEMRAFCLDRASALKQGLLGWSPKKGEEDDDDPIDMILRTAERFYRYVTKGQTGEKHGDECLLVAAEAKMEARLLRQALRHIDAALDDPEQPGETQRLADIAQILSHALETPTP